MKQRTTQPESVTSGVMELSKVVAHWPRELQTRLVTALTLLGEEVKRFFTAPGTDAPHDVRVRAGRRGRAA